MTEPLQFFVPYRAQPKQSVRAYRTKDGKVGTYRPQRVDENAKAVRTFMAAHRPDKPLEGPLRLELAFYYPWRKAATKAQRACGRQPKDTGPDCDNLAKQVADELEHMGFFTNDSQIADLHVQKFWTDNVGVSITLGRR